MHVDSKLHRRDRRRSYRSCLAAVGLALLGAVGTGLAADGDPADADPGDGVATTATARAWLVTQSDADSLAAAATLTDYRHPVDALLLLERAAALEPERPDLLWLQLQLCPQTQVCNAEPLEHRLRELDAGNGAPFLSAAARASARGDAAALLAALDGIAASQRVDFYWTTLVARLSRAMARSPGLSAEESLVGTIGVLAARAIPAFSGVVSLCKRDYLQQPGRLDTCRGVAAAFSHGDTVIAAMLGDSLTMRTWPQDSAQYGAADSDRRGIEARMANGDPHGSWLLSHPGEFFAKLANTRREQDL